MNRQQRRLLARRHEAEARCEKQLEELSIAIIKTEEAE
jgi:hypothetical protein